MNFIRYLKITAIIIFYFFAFLQNVKSQSFSKTLNNHPKGKHELCFDRYEELFNSYSAINISKNLFDLSKIPKSRIYGSLSRDEFYKIIYNKQKLTPIKLQLLSTYLDSILQSVYKCANQFIKDSSNLNEIQMFKIKVDTINIDLVAPDPGDPLIFSTDILKNIFDISLVDIFGDTLEVTGDIEREISFEDTILQNFEIKEFLSDDEGIYIQNPITFFAWVTENKKKTPKCTPFLSRTDIMNILKTPGIIRTHLSQDDEVTLNMFKDGVAKANFQGLMIEYRDDDSYEALKDLINWNKAPLYLKQMDSLIAKLPEDDFFKGNTKPSSQMHVGNYFFNQNQYLLVSNYLTLEIYKYLTFSIAHEAYHVWFAPGEIGQDQEYEADKFATFVYLKVFSDAKFQAANNFQDQFLQKISDSILSSDMKFKEHDNSTSASLFSPFLGPPVSQIFENVYSRTNFYEIQSDAYHPKMIDRVLKMAEISNAESKVIEEQLSQYFSNKIDKLLKKQHSHEKQKH